MKRSTSLVAVLVSLFALPLRGAEQTTVARVYVMQPKPGAPFEQGAKRHLEFHKKANDPWTWFTWQVETGDRAGAYIAATFGHRWKDFDDYAAKLEAADTADAVINLFPNLAGGTNGFYAMRADVSRPPDNTTTPTPLAQLIHFQVKIGGEPAFNQAMKKTHEAIQKTNWPARYEWYELMDGGEGPTFVLVLPMNKWADMQPPELPFPAMLEKAFGREEAAAVMRLFDDSIRSQRTEILRFRADLSYVPSAR